MRICRYISLFISSLLLPATIFAQGQKPRHYVEEADTIPLLVGKQIFFNAAGVALWQFSDYGEVEGGVRVNLKGKFLPVVEVGLGMCDKTDDETDIHYKTSAPFIRVGCDYNFIKNKMSGNMIMGGLRLCYTSFKYDMDAPTLEDPYWEGDVLEYNFSDVKGNAAWAEVVFGLETRIWKHFSLGWSLRYKRRLSHKKTEVGKAWYLPGYGENDGHLFSGTFNLIFEI